MILVSEPKVRQTIAYPKSGSSWLPAGGTHLMRVRQALCGCTVGGAICGGGVSGLGGPRGTPPRGLADNAKALDSGKANALYT